jgi:pyridoxal phosphate enzyme (YggS family)
VTAPTVDAADVARRVEEVRGRIAAAGGERVRLIAVTKGFGADAVRAALAAGVADIGENYGQELEQKAGEVAAGQAGVDVRWHFIGHVQRNKVRRLAPFVHLWHTVDRRELGAEIASRAPGAAVLVQVNAVREPHKAGCDPEDVAALVAQLRALELDVRGLMTIGVAGDAAATRAAFVRVAALAAECGVTELSMGMSDDLEIAVECGATMVRIGRGLFGARPRRADASRASVQGEGAG